MASTSFQMINPIRMDDDERRERLTEGRRGKNHGVEEVGSVAKDQGGLEKPAPMQNSEILDITRTQC